MFGSDSPGKSLSSNQAEIDRRNQEKQAEKQFLVDTYTALIRAQDRNHGVNIKTMTQVLETHAGQRARRKRLRETPLLQPPVRRAAQEPGWPVAPRLLFLPGQRNAHRSPQRRLRKERLPLSLLHHLLDTRHRSRRRPPARPARRRAAAETHVRELLQPSHHARQSLLGHRHKLL